MDTEIVNRIVTSDIYVKNPFFLFRLPIDATSREMRRRKEDVESIFALGQEKEYFSDMFDDVDVAIPQQEMMELYTSLEDPVTRLVYEIFMFWPCGAETSKQDTELRAFFDKGFRAKNKIFEKWMKIYQTSQDKPKLCGTILLEHPDCAKNYMQYNIKVMCAIHNLAVLYHIYAINLEKVRLEFPGQVNLDDLMTYWKEAAKLWRKTLHSDMFWDFLSERAEAINDPRLDARNVRWNFENVLSNSWIAIIQDLIEQHVKNYDIDSAVRLIGVIEDESIKRDVIKNIIKPLHRKIKQLGEEAVKNAKIANENGLELAQKLYEDFLIEKEFVEKICSGESQYYSDTFDEIARAINQCLVVYANKTEDWANCIILLSKLNTFITSSTLKEKIKADLDIIKKNDKEYKELHTCVVCGKIFKGIGSNVPHKEKTIYSPVFAGQFQISTFKVPCCEGCRLTETDAGKWFAIKEKLDQGWSFTNPNAPKSSDEPGCLIAVIIGIILILSAMFGS